MKCKNCGYGHVKNIGKKERYNEVNEKTGEKKIHWKNEKKYFCKKCGSNQK